MPPSTGAHTEGLWPVDCVSKTSAYAHNRRERDECVWGPFHMCLSYCNEHIGRQLVGNCVNTVVIWGNIKPHLQKMTVVFIIRFEY